MGVVFDICVRMGLYCNEILMFNIGRAERKGELSYLAALGGENTSAPYFKQCFFRGGGGKYYPPDSQTPRLPVPREK